MANVNALETKRRSHAVLFTELFRKKSAFFTQAASSRNDTFLLLAELRSILREEFIPRRRVKKISKHMADEDAI